MVGKIRSELKPSAFVASLEQRLKRFRNGRSFISYSDSADFAAELGDWLDDVERHVLPVEPEAAWKLIDRFIRADGRIIERADDSDGWIGDAFRRACSLWHQATAALPRDASWIDRLDELHAENDYGTRDALLDEAAKSLSESELRRLVEVYERRAVAEAAVLEDDYPNIAAAASMGQIACSLGDAVLYERSIRIHSPEPNLLQALRIAEQYVRFGPAERAIEWLSRSDCDPDRLDDDVLEEIVDERLDLLARAWKVSEIEMGSSKRAGSSPSALSAPNASETTRRSCHPSSEMPRERRRWSAPFGPTTRRQRVSSCSRWESPTRPPRWCSGFATASSRRLTRGCDHSPTIRAGRSADRRGRLLSRAHRSDPRSRPKHRLPLREAISASPLRARCHRERLREPARPHRLRPSAPGEARKKAQLLGAPRRERAPEEDVHRTSMTARASATPARRASVVSRGASRISASVRYAAS